MKNHKIILAQTLILIFGLLFNLPLAQQNNDKQLTAGFDKLLSEQFGSDEPGAAALVARNGKIIYKKALGMANMELNVPMHVDNVFRIGSITKQFTAVAILQLMEQGKLNLQDEITRFIPDYPLQGNKITIEHLLTHTSGIRNFTSIKDTTQRGKLDLTTNEMIDYFKNEPMRFAPGTKWEYSNSGYFLLGYIIEKITGKTYGEYIEENFFKPLGMNNSLYANDIKIIKNRADGYSIGENGFMNTPYISMTHPYAAGSILSSVEDLFKWNQAVLSYKLIKKETLAKALSRYILADGKETNYGYGWRLGFIQESPSLWHGGLINGFITMAIYLPEEDVFVAVYSNCDCNSPEDITAKLAALVIGRPYEYTEIPVENDLLQSYTGVFENGRGQQRIITLSENQLYSQLGRSPKTNIKSYQKDMFFFEDDIFLSMEFSRHINGEVEKMTTKSRAGNEVWNKTDKPIPDQEAIKLDEKIIGKYVGEYEVTPEFTFSVTRDQDKLFVQAAGQEKFEIAPETETKFFSKVNDAQFEFVKDGSGTVTKAILNQGGREADAKRIK